jgi:hypothetical protein
MVQIPKYYELVNGDLVYDTFVSEIPLKLLSAMKYPVCDSSCWA